MKLSFSLSAKPSAKPQSSLKPSQTFNTEDQGHSSANKEYVTEFDPSKTLADAQSKNLVIPPISNEWRPHKKMKNLDLPVPSDDPNLQFEADLNSTAEPTDSNMSYGLNLRQSTKNNADAEFRNDRALSTRSESTIDNLMLQKLKNDLNRLPEDRGFEEFDDVPVESFATALLAGYGWHEGRGIGKNAKEDVKVVEYKRWTAKEGIGFVGEVPPRSSDTKVVHKKKEKERQKEKEKEKEKGHSNGDEIVQEEGKRKHSVGKDLRIVGGREVGLKGRIVEVIGGGDSLVLKLSRSEKEVTVRARDVVDLGSVEEERCLKKLKDLKIRGSKEEVCGSDRQKRNKDLSNGRPHRESKDDANHDKRKDSKRSREGVDLREESRESPLLSWLTSHIRVRIISKEFKGGKLYLKKGEVVDVVGPRTCDISMDDSRQVIQGVDQELLETALPRHGGPVLVLYGRHKGVYGSLIEKDMENEIAVVRDADTHALLNVRLEQIAEYIGDPSDIGY